MSIVEPKNNMLTEFIQGLERTKLVQQSKHFLTYNNVVTLSRLLWRVPSSETIQTLQYSPDDDTRDSDKLRMPISGAYRACLGITRCLYTA